MIPTRALVALSLLSPLAACTDLEAPDKGVEDEALVGAKAGSLFDPVVRDLVFGVDDSTAITDDERYHGWYFDLSGNARVSLATAAVAGGPEVDTVIYLYREIEPGYWGRYLAKSDDISTKSRFSRLGGLELTAGRYELLVKGYSRSTRGPFALVSSCDGPGCAPAATGACLFGDTYRAFRDDHTFDTRSLRRVTARGALVGIERDQALAAVRVAYTEAADLDDAFSLVDQGEIYVLERMQRATGERFVAFEYGAGDNSYGAIFRADDAAIAAAIGDGDLRGCDVLAGPGAGPGADCASDGACRDGLACEGIEASTATGVCVVRGHWPGESDDCRADDDCGEHLVCGGAAISGGGLCVPYWMRGSFGVAEGGLIPDAGVLEREVVVYGLATVDMDVIPSVVIGHADPSQLRVTLTNPASNEVVLFDGRRDAASPGLLVLEAPARGFSGDETVNGRWLLRVEDTALGATGDLRSASVTITSRWD